MSSFPESGRSDKVETAEIKGSFRPEADYRDTILHAGQVVATVSPLSLETRKYSVQ